jgi:hypothetical protein
VALLNGFAKRIKYFFVELYILLESKGKVGASWGDIENLLKLHHINFKESEKECMVLLNHLTRSLSPVRYPDPFLIPANHLANHTPSIAQSAQSTQNIYNLPFRHHI